MAIYIWRHGDANAKERLVSEWAPKPTLSIRHLIISSHCPLGRATALDGAFQQTPAMAL
jgi:hypothetical protein